MSKFSFISSLFRSNWFIDPSVALGYMPLLNAVLEHKIDINQYFAESDLAQPTTIYTSIEGKNYRWLEDEDIPENATAHIKIEGPLTYETECGIAGMDEMSYTVRELRNNPKITGMLLVINSPGGTVTGTQKLADSLLSFGKEKPIVAFVDGMAASGAYWLASSAHQVIAANNTVQFGSIGVQMSFADVQPYYEKMGLKFHLIRADKSYDKNEAFEQALQGNYDLIKEESLNPLSEVFIEAMQTNRPQIKEQGDEPFTGKTYLAEKALEFGLIDAIGDYDFALDTLQNLISEMSEKKTSVFDTLAGVFGNKKEEVEANASALVEEGTAMKAEITQLKEEKDSLAAKHNAETQAREAAEERATQLEDKVASLEEKVNSLTSLLENTTEGSAAAIDAKTDVADSGKKKTKFGAPEMADYNKEAWALVGNINGNVKNN